MAKDKLKVSTKNVAKLSKAAEYAGVTIDNAVRLGESTFIDVTFKTAQQIYDMVTLSADVELDKE